jgi:hypothetical protein
MTRFGLRRGLAVAGLAVAASAVVAAQAVAGSVERPGPREVSLGLDTIERSASVSDGVAIHRSRRAARRDPTVAYSVRLRHLGSRRERVRVAGSIYASYCVGSDIDGSGDRRSPCERLADDGVADPSYDLRLQARLYKARGPSQADSGAASLLSRSRPRTCTWDEHHCPITLSIDRRLAAPNGKRRDVNLEVLAWTYSRRRHPGDLLELEGDCRGDVYRHCRPLAANRPLPGDRSERTSTRGELSVLRLGARYGSAPGPGTVRGSSAAIDHPSLDVNGQPTVVHSAKLEHLRAGDVLEANGRVRIAGQGFDHDAESWWVLSANPARALPLTGRPDRYASGDSGTNCLGPDSHLNTTENGSCSISQRGAITVPAHSRKTMYLNYVVEAKDKTTTAAPTATVTGGRFHVRCDPRPRAGPGCAVSP